MPCDESSGYRCFGAYEYYFDTKVRDAAHLAQAVRYVEQNPTRAKLVREPRGWSWSSARLRDYYNRLPWQRDSAIGV